MIVGMEHAVRTPLSIQGVSQKPRLEAHTEVLTEDRHPLHIVRDLDFLELPVPGLALKQLVAEDLPFHGHAQARDSSMAHLPRSDGLTPLRLCQLVELRLSSVQG